MIQMISRKIWVAAAVFCVSVSYPPFSRATPFDAAPDPTITSSCTIQAVEGNFSSLPFHYTTRGACRIDADYNTPGSGNSSTFDQVKQTGEAQWSAVGTYNPTSKETTENITVRQITSAAPGYVATGTIFTTMVCAKDPWVQPDGLSCGSASPQTTGFIDRKYKAIYPGNPTVPATSHLSSTQRAALLALYQKYLALNQPSQQATALAQNHTELFFPTILAPTNGQVVYARTPMAIKLTPPKGWNVSNYIVIVQTKDAKGNWITVGNLPVGAIQASSPTGYTGFGNGAPPAFLALPGSWRLNAQASYPKQSGLSDWVNFTVVTPPNRRVVR